MCNFFLIGWWWGNRVALQKSCALPEVTILHPGGGLSFCKGTQWYIVKAYLLRRNQDPALSLHCCSWLFLLTVPPLFLFREGPSLISNCLNLPFVTQGRSRRWKPFPADKKWGMQEDFGTLEPTASCSVSLPFREMLLSTGAETWQKPVEDVRSRETYFRWEILPYVIYWCE